MAPSLRTHTTALVAALTTASVTTGNHQAPRSGSPPVPAAPPYSVVYLIGGGEVDGPISDVNADGQFIWQVTSVGASAEQAQWQADRVRSALVGISLTVSGRSLQPMQLQFASGGVERDDDLTPPLFYAIERFTAWTFPS